MCCQPHTEIYWLPREYHKVGRLDSLLVFLEITQLLFDVHVVVILQLWNLLRIIY